MKTKDELDMFELKPKFRKLEIDESRLFDKNCPICGFESIIMWWNWKEKKYVHPRCSKLSCKYGN